MDLWCEPRRLFLCHQVMGCDCWALIGILLQFEALVCNGERSPLDGRNGSGNALESRSSEREAQHPAPASVRGSAATAWHLRGCAQMEVPSCSLRVPSASPASAHPGGTGECKPRGTGAGAALGKREQPSLWMVCVPLPWGRVKCPSPLGCPSLLGCPAVAAACDGAEGENPECRS